MLKNFSQQKYKQFCVKNISVKTISVKILVLKNISVKNNVPTRDSLDCTTFPCFVVHPTLGLKYKLDFRSCHVFFYY